VTETTFPTVEVHDLQALLRHVDATTRVWERDGMLQGGRGSQGLVRPWFRGQSDAEWPLRPSVFRHDCDEYWMTSTFRLKALAFTPTPPETDRLDQWLFLMQHYGLPTRLLDWTESPLLAAFFAVAQWQESGESPDEDPDRQMGVWMFHPLVLNLASGSGLFEETWGNTFFSTENFRLPFVHPGRHDALKPSSFPIAVQTSAVALRVAVQRSCFTIYGTDTRDFQTIVADHEVMRRYFVKYVIPLREAPRMWTDLDTMGISFSTAYPDLVGLAKELKFRFRQQ
jgi:hypothetical protein